MKSYLFALVFLLSSLAKVYGIGFYCKKHIVISHGDRCKDIYGNDSKKDYYIKYDELMLYNPNIDCDKLFEKEMICVEVDHSKSPEMSIYKLQPGDTWDSVAKKLNSSKFALYHTNLNLFRYFEDDINRYIKYEREVDYREDGHYNPTFEDSIKVDIKTGKPVKNTKKVTIKKTTTKKVSTNNNKTKTVKTITKKVNTKKN